MARGRPFTSRLQSRQKKYEWGPGLNSSAVQSVTAAIATVVSTGQESLGNQTVVRIRGELTAWIEVATTIGDGFVKVMAGIGIVSQDAFAASAFPSVLNDADWSGWMWVYSGGALVSLETTEVARGSMGAIRLPIDTKAMRKWRLNETVFAQVATSTEIGTATMSFVMNTRLLS